MVRAGELGTGGREATTGEEVGGHSGAESGGGVHLSRLAAIEVELDSETDLEERTDSDVVGRLRDGERAGVERAA